MREHEPGFQLPGGGCRCTICGAPIGNGYIYTCLDRASPGGELMPEPTRRLYASEAWDAIGARMEELRKEKEAVMNADIE